MPWSSILDRVEANPDAPGIRVEAGLHGPAEVLSAQRLLHLAGSAAGAFRAAGVEPGDRIVTLLPTGRPLLQAIFGAWHAGAAVCVMAPVVEGDLSSLGHERLEAMLGIVRPKVIVTADAELRVPGALAGSLAARLLTPGDLPSDGAAIHPRSPHQTGDVAFIQFTSGSTGLPKAIVIEHGQLANHLRVLCRHARFVPSDVMVSWLPLHHDMGFVGGLLTPLFSHCALVLIPTERFIGDPKIWLRTISDCRGTLSPAPSFAYKLLSSAVLSKRLPDIDLASWRFAWIGAEPVSPSIVEAFERTYAPRSLQPGTLHPSYGMAEATLGIAIRGCGAPRTTISISRQVLARDGKAFLVEGGSSEALRLLSNGPALEGMQIQVRDDEHSVLLEGMQGRIFLRGNDIVRRYLGSDEDPQPDGWLDTGDLGFMLDGEVYITGRTKDVIIRGGANVHAHEVEEAVVRGMPGLAQRAVAFAVPRDDDLRDEVVVGVEVRSGSLPDGFAAAVRNIVAKDLGLQIDRVLVLPRGGIPRTTSGKIQRSRARVLFLADKLVPKAD
jgi:acyl-CoA synthetase (AMP-forming)/AMP-acid ligase II